ncbi:MAG TPA: pantetheine-phosphate adenylyltransferase [Polyangiaceae bacterium]|nr:pantetheine-phosphate adenylyltransferase [Polyangiaceae bacterium]
MAAAQLAIYAGSFDPPTNGHLDLVERAARLFPKVVVAIGLNPTRTPLFSVDERMAMLRQMCAPFPNVEVDGFDGLLVDYGRRIGARVIVRGLRVGTDFDYELQIAHANADLAPELDTIFLPTRSNYGFISASLVREIAKHGGDIGRYAPPHVCEALKRKFAG